MLLRCRAQQQWKETETPPTPFPNLWQLSALPNPNMNQKGKREPQELPVGTAVICKRGLGDHRKQQAGSSHANKLKTPEQKLLGQTTHFKSKEAVWYTHAMKHYSVMQGKKLQTHDNMGASTILSERSQTQRLHSVTSFTRHSRKGKTIGSENQSVVVRGWG